MFIDDCVKGTKKIFESDCREVLNIGSEEQLSINQMIEIIEKIADYKVEKNYLLDKPKGVRGRSSNNDLVRKKINWDFETSLKSGLEITYKWIEKEMKKKLNYNKFTIKY
jgi:nucleoside-diphosphate-sugar epimerase